MIVRWLGEGIDLLFDLHDSSPSSSGCWELDRSRDGDRYRTRKERERKVAIGSDRERENGRQDASERLAGLVRPLKPLIVASRS